MWRDRDGIRLDTLFFQLNVAGAVITGDVFPSAGARLSAVTGSCQAVANQELSIIDLLFTWNGRNVALLGLVHLDPVLARVKFKGRFRAFGAGQLNTERQIDRSGPSNFLVAIPPDDGDTGTGTGQQT